MTPSLKSETITEHGSTATMSPFLYPPPNNAPIVIYEDGGGLVDRYIEQAHIYALQKRRIEIRGSCRSACLLALSVPTVCVTPSAQVKAHHAYERESGTIRTDITARMLAELPPNIRQRLDGKIQQKYSPQATLDYSELRKLQIPDCKDQNPPAKDNFRSARTLQIKIANPIERILRIFSGEKR